MKIVDGLYIPKGFQPEDKNGFVNLYSDSDMNLKIKEEQRANLSGKIITLTNDKMEYNTYEEYDIKFKSNNKEWNKITIKPGSVYFYNSETETQQIVSAGNGFNSTWASITILEEPNDAAYEMLKKRSNYNFVQSITIKELVTQQDNELKFNNLSKLILGGGTNGTLSIQRPNTNKEVFQITGLNTNPKVFFKNIKIGNDDKYIEFDLSNVVPLQIKNSLISNSTLKECSIGGSLSAGNLKINNFGYLTVGGGLINDLWIINFNLEGCILNNCTNISSITETYEDVDNAHLKNEETGGISVHKGKTAYIQLINEKFFISFIISGNTPSGSFTTLCHGIQNGSQTPAFSKVTVNHNYQTEVVSFEELPTGGGTWSVVRTEW